MIEYDEFGPERILIVHDMKTGMRGMTAPDMYTGEQEMAWFAEANGSKMACTGQAESMGGISDELVVLYNLLQRA